MFKVENKFPREDRFTWRHNCILLELSSSIRQKLGEVNRSPLHPPRVIHFVRPGQLSTPRPQPKAFGLLEQARDWICDFDLPEFHPNGGYHFPYNVSIESFRCDGYIASLSRKVCFVVELTSPMEENIEYWHKEKFEKYSKISSPDWKFHFLIFEVGCRGFIPSRFFPMLRDLGFNPRESRLIRDNLQLVARKCSYVIWVNRFNNVFKSDHILQTGFNSS